MADQSTPRAATSARWIRRIRCCSCTRACDLQCGRTSFVFIDVVVERVVANRPPSDRQGGCARRHRGGRRGREFDHGAVPQRRLRPGGLGRRHVQSCRLARVSSGGSGAPPVHFLCCLPKGTSCGWESGIYGASIFVFPVLPGGIFGMPTRNTVSLTGTSVGVSFSSFQTNKQTNK